MSERTAAMLRSYPTIDAFLRVYNPADCWKWSGTQRIKCMLTDKAPTLGMLSDAYGLQAAAVWLARHLNCLNGFFNIQAERLPDMAQLVATATSWVNSFPRLKASELWVFLSDWVGGAYGKKIFGAIDPTEMGADLGKYLAIRDGIVEKYRKEAERRAAAHQYDEWKADIERYQKLRRSAEWMSIPEEKRNSIEAFLAIYCALDGNLSPITGKVDKDINGTKTSEKKAQ